MNHDVLPRDWKCAFVTHIYKKGSRSRAENYRPKSLTCILCKIMEKFVREKVMTHLLENKLLTNKQYGFLRRRSTTIQLLNYLDSCVKNIVDGNVVHVIYLVFAKAFDTVPHRRLIGNLESYGISGNLLGWISDFLRERSHIVSVNGAKSASAYVISGIPQGSVLGPALFVIYINILDNIASDGFMFADDTKIFKMIASRNDAIIPQSDMHKLEDWSRTWGLGF